ncbi:MAG: MFS transporter [Propionibacteriaceae bacterium]|jgi:MFS family permease|nr:MFS transporter [Propionibacteriaceae bacterium]
MGMWGQPSTARFLVAAYGPTLLASFGYGAVIPMLAIQAKALGASVGVAAFVAAMAGIGTLLGDLPAGTVTDKFGERRPLVAAMLIDGVALAAAYWIGSLWMFAVVVLVHGITGSVFGLARQTYLTVAVPLKWRARAMSSLGGVFRLGGMLGPLAGAWITAVYSLRASFLLAGAMSIAAAFAVSFIPDTPTSPAPSTLSSSPTSQSSARTTMWSASNNSPNSPNLTGSQTASATVNTVATATATATNDKLTIWSVLLRHRQVLLTVGSSVLALAMVRVARQAIIPLWCDQHGIDASTTNIIYAISLVFEVVLVIPSGAVMDRVGRRWVAAPTMLIMGLGYALLPFTHVPLTITMVASLLGFGNGLSAGIIMTLAADASPEVGRAQFFAGWRVFSDVGQSAGPLVVSAVALFAPLWAAALALAAISWLGGAGFMRWLPRRGPLVNAVS